MPNVAEAFVDSFHSISGTLTFSSHAEIYTVIKHIVVAPFLHPSCLIEQCLVVNIVPFTLQRKDKSAWTRLSILQQDTVP